MVLIYAYIDYIFKYIFDICIQLKCQATFWIWMHIFNSIAKQRNKKSPAWFNQNRNIEKKYLRVLWENTNKVFLLCFVCWPIIVGLSRFGLQHQHSADVSVINTLISNINNNYYCMQISFTSFWHKRFWMCNLCSLQTRPTRSDDFIFERKKIIFTRNW